MSINQNILLIFFSVFVVGILVSDNLPPVFADHLAVRNRAAYVFDCSGFGGNDFSEWFTFKRFVENNNGVYHACGYNWINQAIQPGTENDRIQVHPTDLYNNKPVNHGELTSLFIPTEMNPLGWETIISQFEENIELIKNDLDNRRNSKLIFRGYSWGGGAVAMTAINSQVPHKSVIDFVWLIDPVGPQGNGGTLINDCGVHQDQTNCNGFPRKFGENVKSVLNIYQNEGAPPIDFLVDRSFQAAENVFIQNLVWDCVSNSEFCHGEAANDIGFVFNQGMNQIHSMNNKPFWPSWSPTPGIVEIFEGDSTIVNIAASDRRSDRHEPTKWDYEEGVEIMDLRFSLLNSPNESLVKNGSFELANVDPQGQIVLNSGDSRVDSWNIEQGSIAYVQNIPSSHAYRAIDLSGNTFPNTISQGITTNIGKKYLVSFDTAANPHCGGLPNPKTLQVSAGDADLSFEINVSKRERISVNNQDRLIDEINWENKFFTFTADSDNTVLRFSNPINGCGPFLDNVSVIDAEKDNFYTTLNQGYKIDDASIQITRGGEITIYANDDTDYHLDIQAYDNGFPCDDCRKNKKPDQGPYGKSDSKSLFIVINNVAPTPHILELNDFNFHFSANDPSPIDQAAGFGYLVDWGDGIKESFGIVPELIKNGSFESGSNIGVLFSGDTSISHWVVNSGTIDYLQGYFPASHGARSIDVTGNPNTSPNTISQNFVTEVGQSYLLSFDMAANYECGEDPRTKILDVKVDSVNTLFAVDVNPGKVSWQKKFLEFTATSNNPSLEFSTSINTGCGPLLDNVSITQNTSLIENGSFDDMVPSSSMFSTGDTTLAPWDITSGTIEPVGVADASISSIHLDMSGNSGTAPNTISQNFATDLGQKYHVMFGMAANQHCGGQPVQKTLIVSAGNEQSTFHSIVNLNGASWETKSFEFTAIDTNTILEFSSPDNSGCGPRLDDVSVTPVLNRFDEITTGHEYASAGTYTISLTATDKDLGSDTTSIEFIVLDTDSDGDGVNDSMDNCIAISNPGQENIDDDSLGDACDDSNVISSSKTITSNHFLTSSLRISNNALLTIPAGILVTIPSGSNISVDSGSGIWIANGGGIFIQG